MYCNLIAMASSSVEKFVSTAVVQLTCTDGKTGVSRRVPQGFELAVINITTSLPPTKGPYFVDILLDDGSVYASVPVVSGSSYILDLPAPLSKEISLRMERVAGVIGGAYAYASLNFYNWSEHIEFPSQPIRAIIENVPEVKIDTSTPIEARVSSDSLPLPVHEVSDKAHAVRIIQEQGPMKVSFDSLPLPVHEVSDKAHAVRIVQEGPMEVTVAQPVWTTSQPFRDDVEFKKAQSYAIPFKLEVEREIGNSMPVVSGLYSPSLVAYRFDSLGRHLYSVNFGYNGLLDMDRQTVELHSSRLCDISTDLNMREVAIIYLQIGEDIVPKVAALYEYLPMLAKPEMVKEVVMTDEGMYYSITARPEMDKLPTTEQASITSGELVQKTSNVVIAETQEESFDIASKPYNPVWHNLATTEVQSSYDELCDRMLLWKSFTWKTSDQPENYTLSKDILPRDFLLSAAKSFCSKPNFIPFNVHAYWRGDLKVKVLINSNQFQSGMLLVSWLYASESYGRDDNNGPRYANVALQCMRPHIFIQAGASNEATLTIPYRYVVPYMRTKSLYPGTSANTKPLNMGTLMITPIVPLMTGTDASSPTECTVSVFVGMESSKFTGLVDGAIAKPEMGVGNIIGAALGAISKEIGDVNCDNPPSTRPASFFVPINAQSWSHGTNTYEPVNTLRLNGGRIGVGRSADIGYSDTAISKIVGVYGLLKPIVWSYADKTNNITGKMIWGMNAHPQCDKDRLYVTATQGLMDAYTLPPCAVVSSLYCYWRGSLKFRFEIVCTSKHTGRLLVAYVPGVADYSKITIDQAKSSAHGVFSLNTGTNSFTFDVPYIAETMWWQRKYGGAHRASDFLAPSCIVMFVLNPLVPMESVPQQVTILPFICAGDDFEVAVPGQPSIGLALNRYNAVPDSKKLRFKQGYYPVYVGEWHSFIAGQKVIMRYGAVSDHIAQTTKPSKPAVGSAIYYTPDIAIGKLYTTRIQGGKDGATGIEVKTIPQGNYRVGYAVCFNYNGYDYMIPFPLTNDADNTGEKAARVVAAAVANNRDLRTYQAFIGDWFADSDYLSDGNINWLPHEFVINRSYRAQPEMEREATITREESPNIMNPTSSLPTTRNGIVTFGESFHDLKDLCRRYQLYWEGTVAPGQIRANKRNAAFVQVPVLPQGLKLDASLENPVWNSMREGHIPIVASGFRFYRGGVRMRIVVTGLNDSIWVQHHPDRPLLKDAVIIGSDIHDKDAYRNHGYGFHVQNLSVNRTIEVEIPYYRPGVCGLLGDPANDYDSLYYASLGDVVIGLEGDQPVTDPIDIAIYYTIADDCSFNHFVGFPSMIWCDEVYKENPAPSIMEQDFEIIAAPEMQRVPDVVALGSSLGSMAVGAASSLVGNLFGSVAYHGTSYLSKPVIKVVKDEVKSSVLPIIKDIEEQVSVASKEISTAIGHTLPQQAIINALGQFAQVALNPTAASIAVAVSSLCVQFVTVSIELVLSLQTSLTSFLSNVWHKYFAPPIDLQAGGCRAQPEGFMDEMETKELHGFLGLIFSAVASTVGISVAAPSKFPNIMKGVRECLNVCNSSVVFFRNIVDTIVYMYKYCLGQSSEEKRAQIIIEREYPHMKDWCNEVIQLLDPRNQNVIRHSSRQADRVFDACLYGSKLITENLDTAVPGGRVLLDLYNKICKLRDDLIELGNHPDVRFEPFPIWVCGPAGMGKSHMTNRVCKEMLQAINYQTKEMMIYWLSLGQKYWNGIGNNPVIARDEAYAVGGQFTEEEIATHLAICSSSILNPPMAALQEKNKRLNPYIYYMNSNTEFPTINEARHPEAIYRRRKLLIRAQYSPDILARYPHLLDASLLNDDDVEDYKHLQFQIANDPKDPTTTWTEPMDFAALLRIVKQRFVSHVTKERRNFAQRMRDAYALDPDYQENDNLTYVHQTELSYETLRETYLRQRANARHILYSAPPTIDDDESSYMHNIMQRFSYLWTDSVVPESGEAWYSEAIKLKATALTEATGLNRAAALKLLQSCPPFDDEEWAEFIIDPDFALLVKNKVLKSRLAIHHEQAYISMLPDVIRGAWKRCGFDDSLVNGGVHFVEKTLPYWEDVGGLDSLRSYVYWLMRFHQYKALISLLLSQDTKGTILQHFKTFFEQNGQSQVWEKLAAATTAQDILFITRKMDGFSIHDAAALSQVMTLVLYINRVTQDAAMCEHCKFWVTHIHDTSKIEYSRRQNILLYYNSLGLRMRCATFCECDHSQTRNILFKNAMRILWNSDHGVVDEALNPFTNDMFGRQQRQINSFLEEIWDFAKDWWRNTLCPFVSAVLTFVYEHFGKIIAVLCGLYALYATFGGGKVVEVAADVVVAKTAAHVGSVVAGLLSTAEVGVTKEMPQTGATPESSSYTKLGGVKAATSTQPLSREGSAEQNAMDIIVNKIANNSCFITCSYPIEGGDKKVMKGRCLALRERQILVIKHYLEDFLARPPNATFMLTYYVNGVASVAFFSRECLQRARPFHIGNSYIRSNYAVVTLDKSLPMFKDITSSIALQSEHHLVKDTGYVIGLNEATNKMHVSGPLTLTAQKALTIEGEPQRGIREIKNDIAYVYGINGYGMCGCVLVAEGVCKGNPGILGMHVAGVSTISKGYTEPFYREMFVRPSLAPDLKYEAPILLDPAKSKIDLSEKNLIVHGAVTPNLAHRESGKSKIVPSLVHGEIYPVLTEPNPLKPNDPRQPPGSNPLIDGCRKHGDGQTECFDTEFLAAVSEDNRRILYNHVFNPVEELRLLTEQEAICGSTQIKHCESLNWNSSEGFPLSSERPLKYNNKKYLFDLTLDQDGYILNGIAPRLKAILNQRQRDRDEYIYRPEIYIDCLKDYRLTPAKCAIPGKTRIFSIAPVSVTIDIRRYMGLFLSGYKTACIFGQHGIGINPDSYQWTQLANYLLEVGNNIVTGDYANFGPSLSSQIVASCVDDIVQWHRVNGAADWHINDLDHILHNDIVNPWHLCGDLVYQTINGIASGSPITAELNSEVNKKYIKLAFLELNRYFGFKYTLLDFNDKVRLVTYGDDFIMSVHNELISWFNCETISKILKRFAIVLTDAQKGDTIKAFDSLEHSTFLKRSFKRHPKRTGLWLAPIEHQSITECINWCHKQANMLDATEEVLRASCELAFGQGPDFYAEHVNKILPITIKHKIKFQYPTWEELDLRNFG